MRRKRLKLGDKVRIIRVCEDDMDYDDDERRYVKYHGLIGEIIDFDDYEDQPYYIKMENGKKYWCSIVEKVFEPEPFKEVKLPDKLFKI